MTRGWRRWLFPAAGIALMLAVVAVDGSPPAGGSATSGFPAVGASRFLDEGTGGAKPIWGSVDCAQSTRVRRASSGGDRPPLASLRRQQSDGWRRLTVLDGDDFYGERCELGQNNWPASPVALYHEGDHLITFVSLRLPRQFPLGRPAWQVVMQMKQAQPSDGGGFPTPVLSLHAYDGRWHLYHTGGGNRGPVDEDEEVWSAPAVVDTWVRFALDVRYSVDPRIGSVRLFADLNGDGDALDRHERSRRFALQTLAREQPGTSADGLAEGASIPSHLRVGIYHSPDYRCVRNRCSIGVDNVGVYERAP
jgi:hypothetical protein